MDLVFIYGPVASGKLTVARALAARTGLALFHNHLVVDATLAVFPFGSAEFVALRERWWLDMFAAAARADRSLIFTFAPEPSVAADFPERVAQLVAPHGRVRFVALTLDRREQEARVARADRAAFGKLTSVELLRALRAECDAAAAAMPPAELVVDTGAQSPEAAAQRIADALGLAQTS